MYMFQPQPGRPALTKKQQQEKDAAFKQRLKEAERALDEQERLKGGGAA